MTFTANLESIHVYDQKVGGTNISDKPIVVSYISPIRSGRVIVGVIVKVIAGCRQ